MCWKGITGGLMSKEGAALEEAAPDTDQKNFVLLLLKGGADIL